MVLTDEQELLLRASRGDITAYGELVGRHQSRVFNVAFRMMGRRRDAEDAAQDAFLRAFRALDRFDVTRPFGPWIKRITVNVCLNSLESSSTKLQTSVSDIDRDDGPSFGMDRWSHPDPTPEQALLAKERSGSVRFAILRLPPLYRAVIELRHFQEMRYDEIASSIDRPLSSVKSDLFRARRLLRAYMNEERSLT